MSDTSWTATARKSYFCDNRTGDGCNNIKPGQDYVRFVAFPGHDANPDGPGPTVLRSCLACYRGTPPIRRGTWRARKTPKAVS